VTAHLKPQFDEVMKTIAGSTSIKRALIVCGQTNDWLYPPMMRILRERFGTRFFLVVASDRVDQFLTHCTAEDVVLPAAKEGPKPIGSRTLSPDEVYSRARDIEMKYGLSYMRDIAQQDRTISTAFLSNAPNSVYGEGVIPSAVDLADYINRSFEHYEGFLEKENFDLIINRPSGIADIVMTEVAIARGIPVSYFHGSYFGSGAQWAAGAYLGDRVARAIYDCTPDQQPIPQEELMPSATWNKPPDPQWSSLLIGLLKQLVIYGQFALEDLKTGKRNKRVPFLSNVRSRISQFKVQRYLHQAGEANLEAIAAQPFVYVALPFEPEFTIQSLCREFADPTAWLRQLALALPAGYRMVIKEHQRVGNRTMEYYESFRRFPNVLLAHPGLRGVDLMARCVATATMGGSTPAEAALFGKPSIVFGSRNPYTFLPHMTVVTNPRDLAETLRTLLRPRSEGEIDQFKRAGARFRAAINQLSFDAGGTRLFLGGVKTKIAEDQVAKAVDTLLVSVNIQRQGFVRA
jgi:hypothetical protein